MSHPKTNKGGLDRFDPILQRLQPWILFISILAILFVPGPKGIWWLVLLVLAITNAVRRWKEAWTWFSLQSMGEMLRACLWIPGIVLLYFALHAYAPQFVHASPTHDMLTGKHRLVVDLHLPDGSVHRRAWLFLRIEPKRGRIDLFGEVLEDDDSARALFDFEAVASYGDYLRSSLDGFRPGIPFQVKSGHIPWKDSTQTLHGRGTLGFNRKGKPLYLSLETREGLSLRD